MGKSSKWRVVLTNDIGPHFATEEEERKYRERMFKWGLAIDREVKKGRNRLSTKRVRDDDEVSR